MHVKFFAYYRDYTGCKACDMPAPGTVLELLQTCCDKWPSFRPKLLDEAGTGIGEDAIIMVNGRNVAHLQDKDTPLTDADTIALFPVVAGG
jgi:molybdopterin synthase sulfur carrier subunit